MKSRALAGLTLAMLVLPVSAAHAYQSYGGSFADDDGSMFEANIEAIAAEEITLGCNPPDNDEFCATSDVSRGEMAAFLVRALGLPADSTDRFTDDDDSVFENDIQALAEAEVTYGCNPPDNDEFCPTLSVTRGEMAAFIVRGLGLPADSTDRFTDDDDSVFENDIQALAKAEITLGCNPPDNDKFCPTSNVTRGEMAAFLSRALELSAEDPTPFGNSTCDAAYSPCVPTRQEVGDLDCSDIVDVYPDGVMNDLEIGDPHKLNDDADDMACEPVV